MHAFGFTHINLRLNMSLNHSAPNNTVKNTISGTSKNTHEANLDIAQKVLRAIEEVKQGSGFGSIEIVLHEGRITQIEKREKLRFTPT